MLDQYVVQLSSPANLDYVSILKNIAEYYDNPLAQAKLVRKIDDTIGGLSVFPEGHPLVENANGLKYKYRRTFTGHYNIIFCVLNEEKIVEIVAIYDARQDPEKVRRRLRETNQ